MKRVFSILLVVAMCLSSALTLGISTAADGTTVTGPAWSIEDRDYARTSGTGIYFRPVVDADGNVTAAAYRAVAADSLYTDGKKSYMTDGDVDVIKWLDPTTFSVGNDGFLRIGTTSNGTNSAAIKVKMNGILYTSPARTKYVCVSYRVVGLDDYSKLDEKRILIGEGAAWGSNRCNIPLAGTTEGWNFKYLEYDKGQQWLVKDGYLNVQVPDMNDTNVSFEIDFIGFADTEDRIKEMKAEHDTFVAHITSADFIATPTVSISSGDLYGAQSVTVTAQTGVDIYYTLDGTEPSKTNGTKYTGALNFAIDNDKTNTLKVIGVKGDKTSKVATRTFRCLDLCATPTILPLGEWYPEGTKISIQNNEEGADIYYTTDGKDPTTSSTKYTGPFDLTLDADGKGTVKAIAVKSGKGNSMVASRSVQKQGDDYYYWVFPGITPLSAGYSADGWTLIDGYNLTNDTDGSVKMVFNSNNHNQLLSWLSTTGQLPSASYSYVKICYKSTIAVDCQFNFDWFNELHLEKDAEGNSVGSCHAYHTTHYDLAASEEYTTVIMNMAELCKIWDKFSGGLPKAGMMIDAKTDASATDQFNLMYVAFCASEEAAQAFDMVSIPAFSQSAGFYTETVNVELSSNTEGAEIYYTLDGSTPSKTNGTKYTAPFALNETTTVKAIALKEGLLDSAVVTVAYEINLKAKQPEVSLKSGKYTTEQEVTLSTKTAGAKLYYTTDGTEPTAENGTLYEGPFKLSKTCILRVVAVCEGMENSTVTAVNYKFELTSAEEQTTAAPTDATTDASTDAATTDDKGCASVIGFGTALPVVLAMGAAVLLGKKKED